VRVASELGFLSGKVEHVFDPGFAADAALYAAVGARLVARFNVQMGGPQAAESLGEVLAGVRAGELLSCQLMERVDRTGEFAADGSASMVAYVRGVTGERAAWASRRVNLGRALTDRLPETAAAWGRGTLGLEHASVIQQLTGKLDDELTGEIEAILATAAEHCNPTELNSLGEAIKAQAAPEEATDDAAKKRAAQTLSLSQTIDGRWRLDGWLDSEAGAYVSAAIAAFTRKTPLDAEGGLDPIGLRRAEALVRIAQLATAHAESCNGQATGRHTIVATIPLDFLTSGLGVATLEGGGTITAAAARRWACDTNLIPAVLGADGEILDHGRSRRLISTGQRSYLAQRDGGCLFSDCDRPPADCDAHHRKHWTRDHGKTADTNLDLFCSFHHHLVHEGGWTYTIIDADTLHFHPPGDGPTRIGKRRRRTRDPGQLRS
jgi:hypothetical protein